MRVRELREYLNPTGQKIAEYILQNSKDIVGQPVSVLAQNSGTSKSAVVRFCKSIGCSGYRDFVFQLAAELAVTKSRKDSEYTDVNIGDNVGSILKNICLNNVKAIEDSCRLLNVDDVTRAVGLLIQTKRIDFYGSGASWIVAQDAVLKFARINKFCTAYADPHMQATSAANLSPGSIAIAISWSGETKDVIEATRNAKKSGAKIMTITHCGKNHLIPYADIAFTLSSPETSIRCGAMSSRVAQMTMIDILYSCVVSRDYQNVCKYLERTKPVAPSKRFEREE